MDGVVCRKRIMIGNTCESEVSGDAETHNWRLFVCGECGYNCPLISKIELNVLGEAEALTCEEVDTKPKKGKKKTVIVPKPRKHFEFTGKQQGDLICGTYVR
jgi:hypothetical protein